MARPLALALVREATPMATMQTVQSLRICAHDEGEHCLYWSKDKRAWVVSGKTGIKVQRPSLIAGLSELERFSGVPCNDFTTLGEVYT
jgi:hypothetical protein